VRAFGETQLEDCGVFDEWLLIRGFQKLPKACRYFLKFYKIAEMIESREGFAVVGDLWMSGVPRRWLCSPSPAAHVALAGSFLPSAMPDSLPDTVQTVRIVVLDCIDAG
jgi:hypothetical protein